MSSSPSQYYVDVSISGLCLLAYCKGSQTIEVFLFSAKAAQDAMIETHYPRLYFSRNQNDFESVSLEDKVLDLSNIPGIQSGKPSIPRSVLSKLVADGMLDVVKDIPGPWTEFPPCEYVGGRVSIGGTGAGATVDPSGATWYILPSLTPKLIGHTVTIPIGPITDPNPPITGPRFNLKLDTLNSDLCTLDLGPLTPAIDSSGRNVVKLTVRNVMQDEIDAHGEPTIPNPCPQAGFVMDHYPAYLSLLNQPINWPIPILATSPGCGTKGSFVTCTAVVTSGDAQVPARAPLVAPAGAAAHLAKRSRSCEICPPTPAQSG
jgi:hypothetical protein